MTNCRPIASDTLSSIHGRASIPVERHDDDHQRGKRQATLTASHAAALPTLWPMCIAHSPSLLPGIQQGAFLRTEAFRQRACGHAKWGSHDFPVVALRSNVPDRLLHLPRATGAVASLSGARSARLLQRTPSPRGVDREDQWIVAISSSRRLLPLRPPSPPRTTFHRRPRRAAPCASTSSDSRKVSQAVTRAIAPSCSGRDAFRYPAACSTTQKRRARSTATTRSVDAGGFLDARRERPAAGAGHLRLHRACEGDGLLAEDHLPLQVRRRRRRQHDGVARTAPAANEANERVRFAWLTCWTGASTTGKR